MLRASSRKAPTSSSFSAPDLYLSATGKAANKELERVDQLFYSYANSSSGVIDPEGIEGLCSDLEVDHTDVRVLMLAWKMQTERLGYFTLEEWRRGLKALHADTLVKLKKALVELEREVKWKSVEEEEAGKDDIKEVEAVEEDCYYVDSDSTDEEFAYVTYIDDDPDLVEVLGTEILLDYPQISADYSSSTSRPDHPMEISDYFESTGKAANEELERVDQLFYSYANSSSGVIDPEGIEGLCSDLDVDHTDVWVLMLAWKMQAERLGYFTLEEWRRGLKALHADTLVKLKKALVELEREVKWKSVEEEEAGKDDIKEVEAVEEDCYYVDSDSTDEEFAYVTYIDDDPDLVEIILEMQSDRNAPVARKDVTSAMGK